MREEAALLETAAASGGAGVSLGKGAWDCDNKCEIPPEKEVSSAICKACKLLAFVFG